MTCDSESGLSISWSSPVLLILIGLQYYLGSHLLLVLPVLIIVFIVAVVIEVEVVLVILFFSSGSYASSSSSSFLTDFLDKVNKSLLFPSSLWMVLREFGRRTEIMKCEEEETGKDNLSFGPNRS